jgi:hypothetical protein
VAGDPEQIPLVAPLAPLEGEAELPGDDVTVEGGSRPHIFLLASDLAEYICKGPSLMANHPFIGVNEWVVASIARAMTIPVRPFELIGWQGNVLFGSQLLKNDRKMTGLASQNWARLKNAPEIAYEVVVLDVWTLNTDRHDQNWLGGVLGEQGIFMVSDHDLCILGMNTEPEGLAALVQQAVHEGLVRTTVIRDAIREWTPLLTAVAKAEHVDDAFLRFSVGQVPTAWLTDHQKDLVAAFLIDRKHALRDLFLAARPVFPNLTGDPP